MAATNQIWELKPNIGVGPLLFGMALSDIEEILGHNFVMFRHDEKAHTKTYAFRGSGVHATFDLDSELVELGIHVPNQVLLNNIELLGTNTDEVASDLIKTGIDLTRIDVGFWSERLRLLLIQIDEVTDGVELGRIMQETKSA